MTFIPFSPSSGIMIFIPFRHNKTALITTTISSVSTMEIHTPSMPQITGRGRTATRWKTKYAEKRLLLMLYYQLKPKRLRFLVLVLDDKLFWITLLQIHTLHISIKIIDIIIDNWCLSIFYFCVCKWKIFSFYSIFF